MAGAVQYGDLYEHIERPNVECLNESPEHTVANIFGSGDGAGAGSSFLESDTDEELLVNVPFRQQVKVHSMEFTAPNDGRKPNSIKIFTNHPSFSFEDCEDVPPIQEAELEWVPAGDVHKAVLVTRFVKFQAVNSLHIYVTSNTEDSPTTCISSLTLYGAANGDQFKWNPKQG
eukprot:TRINITY_DN21134_c0_g1_i1.p1 TRINITY_DN21134_c0_g1~~TRINITY_DN21134_c0_g1_i1.p1  ORF type:complete len:195 (+),score=49.02 TRINITY_DN21134_c0_g1_i1:69-587(+)